MNHLTERDIKVLLELHDDKYLSTSQIQTLFFPTAKKASKRLKILFDDGYIGKFEKPTFTLGRGEYVFYLKKEGGRQIASLLNTRLENQMSNITAPKSLLFIDHLLSINDFRIYLKLACEKESKYSFSFIPEYNTSKGKGRKLERYIKDFVEDPEDPNNKIAFIPDGVFYIEDSNTKRRLLFFCELCRGTETVESPIYRSFLIKIKAYCNYFDSGGYTRYNNNFNYQFNGFRVLVVTTSDLRLKSLMKACLKYGDLNIFWFTIFDRLSADTIFGKIWETADTEDKTKHSLVETSENKSGDLGGDNSGD